MIQGTIWPGQVKTLKLTTLIYFDHNATSPLNAIAREAWLAAAERFPANPSSPHRLGARAELALSNARQEAATHLGCSEFDLVWTSGATESNNAILHHASRTSDGEAWLSAIEHPSAIAAARRWFGDRVRMLPVNTDGVIELDWFAEQLPNHRPAIVMVMAANNETGVLQPWTEVLRLCREREVPFACDAAQWIGKLPAGELGQCDYVSGSAHKIGGPPGVGFLKVSHSFHPLVVGGPQEHSRRAGTENLPGAVALAAMWSERERQMVSGMLKNAIAARDCFIAELKRTIPEIEIVGERSARLWNTVAALMPELADCRRRWVVQLDKQGFAVSTGSACSSGKAKASHVLTAMGFAPEKADRMLRFSAGWETTEADWRKLLEGVQTAYAELRPTVAV